MEKATLKDTTDMELEGGGQGLGPLLQTEGEASAEKAGGEEAGAASKGRCQMGLG